MSDNKNVNDFKDLVYHLSFAEEELMKQLNQTHTELTCELRKNLNTNLEGCGIDYDTVLCWPQTPPNSLSVLPCLSQLNGIRYDTSRKFVVLSFFK